MKKYTLDHAAVAVSNEGGLSIHPNGSEKYIRVDALPFSLSVCGNVPEPLGADGFVLREEKQNGNILTLTYENVSAALAVTVRLESFRGGVIQKNTVKNIGKSSVLLTRFSSALVAAESPDDGAWYEKDIKVHICYNKWSAEGQWRALSPSELGLFPACVHDHAPVFYSVGSVGSWSTHPYYPLIILENKTDGTAFFTEAEGGHSWRITLTVPGGFSSPAMIAETVLCDEEFGYWHRTLLPSEEYSTERAVYGTVRGGFEEAVAALNDFKRSDSQRKPFMPLVFNDYMDCIWGCPAPERLFPLMDKAKEAGCEYFCIDGGWYQNKNGLGLGDWIPKKEYYSEISLADVAASIRERGMIPGIWFELEACTENAELFKEDTDFVLRRSGRAVGAGGRHFLNFTKEEVRAFLLGRVRALYDMGFRYIKHDYNQSVGIGCTNLGTDSPAEGLIRQTEAFYRFIDELYEHFPDLVLENCASGALRSDNKTLRRFTLQSTSDQELFLHNPSIVMGSCAIMPPEKAGVWAYPYPTDFATRLLPFEPQESFFRERADGKETVFNMVSGLSGVLYLSGRIDLADEKNFALIKEGAALFKEIRKNTAKSRPIYPLGMHPINEKAIAAFGLLGEKHLMLSLWNTDEKERTETVDLSRYLDFPCRIARIYSHETPHHTFDGGKLCVTLPEKSAAWFFIVPNE